VSVADPVDLVRRLVAAANRGDVAAMRELLAPDHVDHPLTYDPPPLPGTEGDPVLDRYEQADATMRRDFPDLQIVIDEALVCGDRVVSITTSRGTHAASGLPVTVRGISIDRVADGKIAETWASWDRLGIYQQLGVVEPTSALVTRAGLTP
jgi:ketosteroid isomerase-like protein